MTYKRNSCSAFITAIESSRSPPGPQPHATDVVIGHSFRAQDESHAERHGTKGNTVGRDMAVLLIDRVCWCIAKYQCKRVTSPCQSGESCLELTTLTEEKNSLNLVASVYSCSMECVLLAIWLSQPVISTK